MENQITTKNIFDVVIRLAVLALVVGWCLLTILPFASIILWSLILTIAIAPLHVTLTKVLGNRPKTASAIIVIVGVAIILIPGWLFLDSIIDGVRSMRTEFAAGTLSIPKPSEKVKEWPLIGNSVYTIWYDASTNLGQTISQYRDQLLSLGRKIAGGIMSILSGSLQMIASLIIAGFLVVMPATGEAIRKFFRKVSGDRGDEFADITYKTVGNVVKGILGVSFIQSILIGIGLILAGVPYAGLLTLIVFIFAVLQIPPTIIVIPIIIYLFSTLDTLPAILWGVYLLLGGMSDNVLKPILLGKGAPVPMLVIFLGVLGGFMLSGFIGLFTGAIIVSLGYKLLIAWIADATPVKRSDSSIVPDKELPTDVA